MLLAVTVATTLVSFLIALAVYLRDSRNKVARELMGVLGFSCLWVVGVNVQGVVDSHTAALWLLRFSFVFAILTGYFLLRFAGALVNRPQNRRGDIASWVVIIGLVVASLSSLVIGDTYESKEVSLQFTTPSRGILYPLIVAGILWFVARAILVIGNVWHRSSGVKRVQLSLVIWGLALGAVSGILTNVVLPNIYHTTYPSRFAFITIIIWTAMFAYAVFKHRFLNMRLVVARTVGYVLTLALLAAMYSLAIFWFFAYYVKPLVQNDTMINLIQVVLMLLLALSFAPMKRFFDLASNRLFYRESYDPQTVIDKMNAVLVASTSLESLANGVAGVLRKSLKTSYTFVYFHKPDSTLSQSFLSVDPSELSHISPTKISHATSKITGTFPRSGVLEGVTESGVRAEVLDEASAAMAIEIRRDKQSYGHIILGYKKSGDGMNSQDEKLLKVLVGEVAIATQNVLYVTDIKNFNDTLRERVDEATDELRQNNKKLKQMDQTKDEFISLTSHQLRTPLTTVKGYLSMLLDGDAGEVTPQQRKLLEEAFNSSQRMVHLISDFLNISRIQTGKFVVELADVNLADILDEEIDQLRVSAVSRGIGLAYNKPANFPIMPVDEGKIRQVMMNYIDNAIYYSPSGSTITITLSFTTDVVEFKVIDQGIGVPKAEQHKLFNKFSRASNARKQRPDGTGIGLFMAKKVIVALGGAVIFESVEGKGSTFGFRLNRTR